MPKMKAAIFIKPGRIVLDEKPIPDISPLDALVRITTTTICGTDIRILKGEYPVAQGLTIGHEPVGVIEKLGSSVTGFREGQRVIAGAITPSGQSSTCLCGCLSQDGPGERHGFKAIGGWKFGNTIDGCQAEFVRVPDAIINLAPVPDTLTEALSRELQLAAGSQHDPVRVHAALAARHVRKASSRKTRSVRRDVRWRWTLKIPWRVDSG